MLDKIFVPVRKTLGYVLGVMMDLFSVLLVTLGTCTILETLLPAKLGVAQRAMTLLSTIGIKAEYVPIILVALIVAYVAKSRYTRPSI